MDKMSVQHKLNLSKTAIARSSEYAIEYLEQLDRMRVSPSVEQAKLLDVFDESMPPQGMDANEIVQLLHKHGSPNTVATAGGRYFGLVVGGSLPACAGSRTLMAAWDQIGTTHFTSPITSKLESVASDWILDIFSLPKQSSVGFVTGTTMGNFVCLAAARHFLLARLGWNVETQGLMGCPLIRVLASKEVHFTVKKVLALLGIGTNIIEPLEVDDDGAIAIDKLPTLDDRCLILTQAGNVNSGAIDPIGAIAAEAKKVGAWVHVDGAFGLWAAASEKKKKLIQGFECADSWVTDGHKWLNTPYDCGIAICRNAEAVHNSMSTTAPYFAAAVDIDAKDMMPELSRSARGIDIWAALKNLGKDGVASLIDRNCEQANRMASGLKDLGFDVLNAVVLNQVVATFPSHEDQIDKLVKSVVDSGEAWFGVTEWQSRSAFRISFSSWVTTLDDVETTLKAIKKAKQKLGW